MARFPYFSLSKRKLILYVSVSSGLGLILIAYLIFSRNDDLYYLKIENQNQVAGLKSELILYKDYGNKILKNLGYGEDTYICQTGIFFEDLNQTYRDSINKNDNKLFISPSQFSIAISSSELKLDAAISFHDIDVLYQVLNDLVSKFNLTKEYYEIDKIVNSIKVVSHGINTLVKLKPREIYALLTQAARDSKSPLVYLQG